jgi:hypothetical protein
MLLRSPEDDFVLNTLAAVPGVLGRLEYLAGLRTRQGAYCHWGLEQAHGEAAAAQAIARAHTQVWLQLLRTPLPVLLQELRQMQDQNRVLSSLQYLRGLAAQVNEMVPEARKGGSLRHFNSILSTLAALCRAQRDASRPAA